MSNDYQNMQTSDIIVEVLIDWGIKVIFGMPGDGINGVMEHYVKDKTKSNLFL